MSVLTLSEAIAGLVVAMTPVFVSIGLSVAHGRTLGRIEVTTNGQLSTALAAVKLLTDEVSALKGEIARLRPS